MRVIIFFLSCGFALFCICVIAWNNFKRKGWAKRLVSMWWYKRVIQYWRIIRWWYETDAALGDREKFDYASIKGWEYASIYDKIRDCK